MHRTLTPTGRPVNSRRILVGIKREILKQVAPKFSDSLTNGTEMRIPTRFSGEAREIIGIVTEIHLFRDGMTVVIQRTSAESQCCGWDTIPIWVPHDPFMHSGILI